MPPLAGSNNTAFPYVSVDPTANHNEDEYSKLQRFRQEVPMTNTSSSPSHYSTLPGQVSPSNNQG